MSILFYKFVNGANTTILNRSTFKFKTDHLLSVNLTLYKEFYMLIRYRKNQEKIAMGLLSFMSKQRDIKQLQQTMKEYEDNENWHLYLWKYEEDIIGAIGLKIEDDLNVNIQHISVNPSFRNIGVGRQMVDAIHDLYGKKYDVGGNEETEHFFSKYKHNKEESE